MSDVGQQDRDDYRDTTFCSIQCEVKLEHIKADAMDAKDSMHAEAEEPEGYF